MAYSMKLPGEVMRDLHKHNVKYDVCEIINARNETEEEWYYRTWAVPSRRCIGQGSYVVPNGKKKVSKEDPRQTHITDYFKQFLVRDN
jgi:hypothetical protein